MKNRKEKLPASPEGKWKTSLATSLPGTAPGKLDRIVPRNTRIFQGRSGASGRLGEIPGSILLDGGLIKKRGHLPPASQPGAGGGMLIFFVPPFRAFATIDRPRKLRSSSALATVSKIGPAKEDTKPCTCRFTLDACDF